MGIFLMQDGLEGIFKCSFVDEKSTNEQDMPTNRGKTINSSSSSGCAAPFLLIFQAVKDSNLHIPDIT